MESRYVIQIIEAVAWPLVAVIAVIAFRKPLSQFLAQMGGRATKLSIFQFAVELAKISEFNPSWTVGAFDARRLSPASVFDSYAQTLFNQIADSTASDYAVIDLGEGEDEQWLTSRLFIFAVMLERMRNLKAFVFVETSNGVRRRFIGMASPQKVRWALARQYPWLETALAEAYASIVPKSPATGKTFILTNSGALEQWQATQLAKDFLNRIQQGAPPAINADEWVELKDRAGQPLWEHAEWIQDQLEQVFGDILETSSVVDDVDSPNDKRVRSILRREGQFIAEIDGNGVFKSLIDRGSLVERAAKDLSKPTESTP